MEGSSDAVVTMGRDAATTQREKPQNEAETSSPPWTALSSSSLVIGGVAAVGVSMVALHALVVPFLLPALRRHSAPYVYDIAYCCIEVCV